MAIASPPGPLAEWARDGGFPWTRLDLSREPSLRDASSLRELRRLLADVDLVFLHSSKAGAVGRLACSTMGGRRPACVFVPHAWSWYMNRRAAPLYRRFEQLAAHWADAIVAVSGTEALDGRSTLSPAGARKIVTIENGVDSAHFSPPPARPRRRKAPLVVCVGRLCEQKGQDLLIGALAALDDPSVRLRLVGSSPAEPALRAQCVDLGVADRVEFVGTAAPRQHYWEADLVVLPSRWEGRSLVLLEAMACGATVVASSSAGAGFGREQGVVVVPPEVGALAQSISGLLGAPAVGRRLGALARRTVEEQHSTVRVVEEYLRLTDSLLGLPADRPPVASLPWATSIPLSAGIPGVPNGPRALRDRTGYRGPARSTTVRGTRRPARQGHHAAH